MIAAILLIVGPLARAALPPPPCATELAALLPGKIDPTGEQHAARRLLDGTEVARCQWEAAPGATGVTLIRVERALLPSVPAVAPAPSDLLGGLRELLGAETPHVLEPTASPWLQRGEHRLCATVLTKGKSVGAACAAVDQDHLLRFVVLGVHGSSAAILDAWQDPR